MINEQCNKPLDGTDWIRCPMSRLILHYYEMILDGCSLMKLTAEAEKQKHAAMGAVV